MKYGRNPRYLQNVEFDTNRISFYNDIDLITADSDILVLAIPSAYLPTVLGNAKTDISKKYILSGDYLVSLGAGNVRDWAEKFLK